jgi:glycosyltransferase involved in cell wall biosynthesis
MVDRLRRGGARGDRIEIEFSLALHEKTGKYFIGRDVGVVAADRVQSHLIWRLPLNTVPNGLAAKVIGRLLSLEVNARVRSASFDRLVPRQRRARPVLHMDPYTVLLHQLSADDIVLCHDVGPLTHPDLFDPKVVRAYRKAYREINSVGPHMVFVSHASRSAFHALFDGAFASSRVIYPTLRTEMIDGPQEPAPGVTMPFLLTVGSVGARKNQRRAIEAFARSGLAAKGVQYVLCGGREPGYEEVEALAAQTPGVRLFGYVADPVLNWLYGNARGFVLPSLLEGFGVPVAEAVARGLTPMVSVDSVLHEVAGDGALLVDPEDTLQIAAAMGTLIAMPEAEATARRASMALSLSRFSAETFAQSWRDMVRPSSAVRTEPEAVS